MDHDALTDVLSIINKSWKKLGVQDSLIHSMQLVIDGMTRESRSCANTGFTTDTYHYGDYTGLVDHTDGDVTEEDADMIERIIQVVLGSMS